MRVLMVVPRYGASIVGGAETLVRGLARRALSPEHEVQVATTCAVDHMTWANAIPAGVERDGPVVVHRFPVSAGDRRAHARLHTRLMSGGRLSYLEQEELLATSVVSAELERFVEREGRGFDLVICAPYLFGVSFWAAHVWPERTVLIPCLHDEPYAYLDAVKALVGGVRGCIFNSAGEERLARRLFSVREGSVVGTGLEEPDGPADGGFAERHGIGRYLLYAGRIEEGKNVDVAVDHMARYRRERGSDLRLALIGTGAWRPPSRHDRAAVVVGYVSERERRSAYAGALALVNPSDLESLSLVLLEAWLEGVPALVSAGSEVMRDHVRASGGGLAFDGYASFADALDRIVADPAAAAMMGAAGRDYVRVEYSWPSVRSRMQASLRRLVAVNP